MKQILPISIWYNGQIISATIFNMISTNDNLIDNASFYWQLYTTEQIQVSQGNITMSGEDYINYSTSTAANDYAYQWGATQLNITLV